MLSARPLGPFTAPLGDSVFDADNVTPDVSLSDQSIPYTKNEQHFLVRGQEEEEVRYAVLPLSLSSADSAVLSHPSVDSAVTEVRNIGQCDTPPTCKAARAT